MKVKITTIALLAVTSAFGQNPVSWNYSAKKVGDNLYEIHVTATAENGWHVYSQTQPENAIAIPTELKFNANPLVILNGKVQEVGKLIKKKEPSLGTEAWQYAGEVDFVQTVKLKIKAKTSVNGSVEFQTCTDEKCLPPRIVQFKVAIN